MPLAFAPPPGTRFTCSRCGDCCRSWNVMLAPGEEEQLAALDWRGRESDLEGTPTVVATSGPAGQRVKRLLRKDDGACVYLGADQLCRIHKHFGGDRKPLMCRLYPFGFYPVGERVAVDCSYACRSVAAGSGAPVERLAGEWQELLAEAAGGRGPQLATLQLEEARHEMTRGRGVAGDLLWEIEQHLATLLGDRSLSLLDRVRCCLQFLRLATAGDPTAPTAARLRQAIAAGLPKQIARMPRTTGMDKTQRTVFYQWLFLALNPLPVNLDLLAAHERRREEQRRLAAVQGMAQREGAPWVDNRELAVSWAAIDAVDAGPAAAAQSPLLERFLLAKLLGQRFLVAGDSELPLLEAAPLFFLVYPMAIWTARALAAERGARTAGEDDLRRAVALLDRTLGQVPLNAVPGKLAKAWRFVVEDTDLVVAATDELLGYVEPESADPLG